MYTCGCLLGNPHHAVVHQRSAQVSEASDEKALQAVCMEGMDMLLEAGYSKPIACITLAGRADLTSTLMYHYTLYRNKAVLDQLKDGLSALGVLDAMKSYPDVIMPYFVHGKQPPLTAGIYNGSRDRSASIIYNHECRAY